MISHPFRAALISVWVGYMVAAAGAQPLQADFSADAERQAKYFEIETLDIPEDVVLEVTGLATLPGDRLAAVTRRGELWIVSDVSDTDIRHIGFTKFAEGLHEPMSVTFEDDWFYVTQRSELTKIQDRDGDGFGDFYQTLTDKWGISGDYHEFAWGSPPDKDGNIWVALCLTGGKTSDAFLRGWAVRVTPDGEMIPSASGIRSPGGMNVSPEGEVFYTDNQGFWNGSSALKHLKPGSFQGSPVGNIWYQQVDAIGPRPPDPHPNSLVESERARISNLVPPAVVFPHGRLGQSPTGMVWNQTGGAFGPYEGQLFVAEYTFAQVQRVFLEEVNGVMQGATFPFLSELATGAMNLAFSERGQLYVGGLNRGWPSLGEAPYALQRISWNGETPLEILEMRVTQEGFDLEFTKPVDRASAVDLASYQMQTWTYLYRELYGSPEVDHASLAIASVLVSDDARTVSLIVPDRVKGHVHMLETPGIRAADGDPVLHPIAYYTLNEIPATKP